MSYYNIPRQPVREYAGGSVGGILRKGSGTNNSTNTSNGAYTNYASTTTSTTSLNAGEARQVDLLVFGYACKLFRDDDKARDIDQGKHMIPWMGDATLKIDRYDVRGALSELAPHEPPPGGYGNRLDYLSAEEQRAELLCEEERYLYLYNNEEDHILQQEEDLKRLKQDVEGGNYAQVDFQYGNDGGAGVIPHGPNREEHNQSPNGEEEAEQAFSLPKGFEVPITIQLPETMKQHAIIEKTARFIASQGMQMEILLKAKQSNNVQFEFLAINGVLNPYYKYILNAIKNDTYPAESAMSSPNAEQSTANSRDIAPGASAYAKPIIPVPTIKYIPSANCAYTQLISKIKGVPLPAVIDGELANMPAAYSPTSTTAAVPASANFTPVLLQYNNNAYVSADAEDGANSNSNSQINGAVRTEVELLNKSSALSLAQDYASDTESEAEEKKEEPERMKTPPPPKFEPILNFPVPMETLKNIIDKTASYVIKNGRQFEETLRSKSVDRFTFLLYDNEHYPYYLYKVTGDPDAASKEQKQRKAAAVAAALMSKKKLLAAEKSISPVCFSIKSKEDSMLQPALPREPSDDDEESTAMLANSNKPRTVPEHVQKAIQMVESQLMARNAQIAATISSRNTSNALLPAPTLVGMNAPSNQATSGRFDNFSTNSASSLTKSHLKNSKAEIERNALFEQQQQNRQKELRKAEEKVKDKLAKIAREKLGAAPVTKEKQLQLERKRKAMAFITHIKGSPSADTSEKNSPSDPEKSNANGSDSDASVNSIPITSYGPEDDGNVDEQEKQRLIEIPTTHIAGETPAVMLCNPPSMTEKGETKPKALPTVNVSDDDDVQLVSEINPIQRPTIPKPRKERKRQLRSRTRDSSEDAKPKSSAKTAHKRKHRLRSPSSSKSSEDDDSSSSSESSSTSSSSSSSTTTTSSSSTSTDSSEDGAAEHLRSHSRRKHKSRVKSLKKFKTPKSSKSVKSEAIRIENKKKSRKRTHEEEYKLFKAEHKAHKERERARKLKQEQERALQKAYEREQIERIKRHSRQHSASLAPTAEAYQQQKRLQRAQQKAEIQLLAAAAKREQERERQREYEHRERRKHRERERERERDRSNPPTSHYDTPAQRREKKKKRERER